MIERGYRNDPAYQRALAAQQERCAHTFTEGAVWADDPRTFTRVPVLRRVCLKCERVIDQRLRAMPLKPLLGGPPTFSAPGRTTDVQRWGDLVITEREY